MLLKIARAALSDLVNRGGVSAARNAIVPIMSHVLLRAEDGRLSATSCDLATQSSAFGEAEVETEGVACVEAQALKLFVDRLPQSAVVKIELEADKLVVSAGRSRARLGILPTADFASLDIMTKIQASFTLTPDDMTKLFGRTVPSVEKGGARYYLEGVFLHVYKGRLRAVATNGHSLIAVSIDGPEGLADFGKMHGSGFSGVIVPAEAVNVALRLFAREPVQVIVTEAGIEFAGATSSIVAKVVDGTFPDCERVIPAACENRARIDRASVLNAIGVVEVFQSRDSGAQIECGEDAEGLAMAAGQGAEGDGFAVADAEFEGKFPTFGISSKYLRMVLGAFTGDNVIISLADPGSPLRFFVEGDDTVTGVVMPMRVRATKLGQGART